MAAKGGHIDFMFLPPNPSRPMDLLLELMVYNSLWREQERNWNQ